MKLEDKITKQKKGACSDIQYQKKYKTVAEAKSAYKAAKYNLLNVNNWHNIAGLFSGKFILTDQMGKQVQGRAEKNLYFKINIPAPGMVGSKGYDWVIIEDIYEESSDTNEWIILKVKPAADPENKSNEIIHFFTSEARSNFCVERKNKVIKASVFGRNEKPNIYSSNFFNRFRNWIIGKLAAKGLNTPQWKGLVKGILLKSFPKVDPSY